jgi:hypothetical protein
VLKYALKLMIVMAMFVTVAGLTGWKWTTNVSMKRAADYSLAAASATGPVAGTSTGMSVAADASVSVDSTISVGSTSSSSSADSSASAVPSSAGDSASTSGWTWD